MSNVHCFGKHHRSIGYVLVFTSSISTLTLRKTPFFHVIHSDVQRCLFAASTKQPNKRTENRAFAIMMETINYLGDEDEGLVATVEHRSSTLLYEGITARRYDVIQLRTTASKSSPRQKGVRLFRHVGNSSFSSVGNDYKSQPL
jgi:hypothetical protein